MESPFKRKGNHFDFFYYPYLGVYRKLLIKLYSKPTPIIDGF
jgi:hypothetical protein